MFDHLALVAMLFAQQNHRLPTVLRTKMMMALFALVLLAMGLAGMILLGGWAVKRRIRQRSGPSNKHEDAWYKKPLEPAVPDPAAPDDHDE